MKMRICGLAAAAMLWASTAQAGVPELPSCSKSSNWDKFVDGLSSTGSYVVYGLPRDVRNEAETLAGTITKGDPDQLLDQLERGWENVKRAGEAAGGVAFYAFSGGVVLLVLEDLLPGGKVRDFLVKGRKLADDLRNKAVGASFSAFEQDLTEISGDAWSVLSKIDDPKAFAEEFGRVYPKWDPMATWTLMLTEDDPLEGMKKAAAAYYRQYQVVSRYASKHKVPVALIRSGMVRLAKGEAKVLLQRLGDIKQKQALAAMSTSVLTGLASGESPEAIEHPFYKTARVKHAIGVPVWSDKGSGGGQPWSTWRPKLDKGCISLGDVDIRGHGNAAGIMQLKQLCNVKQDPKRKWWAYPTDYTMLWTSTCSPVPKPGTIWSPVCPEGFTAVGFVAGTDPKKLPGKKRIACLLKDDRIFRITDGKQAGMKWQADDSGSKAAMDVSVWQRNFAGMEVTHFAPAYPPNRDPKGFDVAAAWWVPGAPNPKSFAKAYEKEAGKLKRARPAIKKPRGAHEVALYVGHGGALDAAGHHRNGAAAHVSSVFDDKDHRVRQQRFFAKPEKLDYVTIISADNGKCMEVRAGGTADGAPIVQAKCDGSLKQKWKILEFEGGETALQNGKSLKCMNSDLPFRREPVNSWKKLPPRSQAATQSICLKTNLRALTRIWSHAKGRPFGAKMKLR